MAENIPIEKSFLFKSEHLFEDLTTMCSLKKRSSLVSSSTSTLVNQISEWWGFLVADDLADRSRGINLLTSVVAAGKRSQHTLRIWYCSFALYKKLLLARKYHSFRNTRERSRPTSTEIQTSIQNKSKHLLASFYSSYC